MEETKQDNISIITSIESLEINNFKSFGSSNEPFIFVGPFLKFTSIVGPNGGGKSNIIDAICFVLGITTANLRTSTLKDLIYHQQNQSAKGQAVEQLQQCSVTLNLNTRRSREDPIEQQQVQQQQQQQQQQSRTGVIKLCRTIQKDTTWNSHYFINNIEKDEQEYETFLIQNNIIPQAKNFLMQQGETDCLATLKPEKLTEYFEKASRSNITVEEYKQAQQELESLKAQIAANTIKLNQLKSDKRKMKQIRQTSTEYAELLQSVEQDEIRLHLLKFLHCDSRLLQLSKELDLKSNEQALNDTARREKTLHLQLSEKQLKEQRNAVIQMQEELSALRQQVLEQRQAGALIEKQKITLAETSEKHNLTLKQRQAQLIDLQREENQLLQKEAQLKAQLQSLEGSMNNNFGQNMSSSNSSQQQQNINQNNQINNQQQILKQQVGPELYIEFEDISLQTRTKGFQLLQELSKQRNQAQAVQMSRQVTRGQISAQQEQANQLQQQIQQATAQLEQRQLEKKEAERALEELSQREKDLAKEMGQTQEKRQRVADLKLKNERLLRQHELLMQQYNEEVEADEVVQELKRTVKGCVGSLAMLVGAHNLKNEPPVKSALAQAMNYVVVQTAADAKLCNEYLKSRGMARDLLILENVPDDSSASYNQYNEEQQEGEEYDKNNVNIQIQQQQDGMVDNEDNGDWRLQQLRQELAGEGQLVYDMIDFDRNVPNLDKALRYFLNGKVCCKTLQNAFKLRSNPALKKIIRQIITLDGNNIINVSSGLITSSSMQDQMGGFLSGNKKKLSNKEKKRELEQNLEKLKNEIMVNVTEIDNLQNTQCENDYKKITIELNEKKTQVMALINQISNVLQIRKQQLDEQAAQCQATIRQLTVKIKSEEQDHQTAILNIEATQKEIRELANKMFQAFCQKAKIDYEKFIMPALNFLPALQQSTSSAVDNKKSQNKIQQQQQKDGSKLTAKQLKQQQQQSSANSNQQLSNSLNQEVDAEQEKDGFEAIEEHFRLCEKTNKQLEECQRRLNQLGIDKIKEEVRWLEEQGNNQAESAEQLNKNAEKQKEERIKNESLLNKLTDNLKTAEQNVQKMEKQLNEELSGFKDSRQEIKKFEMELNALKHDIIMLLQKKYSLLEEARLKGLNIPLKQQPSQIEYHVFSQLQDVHDLADNRQKIHVDYSLLDLKKLKKIQQNNNENDEQEDEDENNNNNSQEEMKDEQDNNKKGSKRKNQSKSKQKKNTKQSKKPHGEMQNEQQNNQEQQGNSSQQQQQQQQNNEDDESIARDIDLQTLDIEEGEVLKAMTEKSEKLEAMSSRAREEVDSEWDSNEERIHTITEKLDQLVQQQHKAEERMTAVRELRKTRFLKLFEPVKLIINEIYQMLSKTRLDNNNNNANRINVDDTIIAGSALLYLENSEEPFNGGVIFSPTPPRKTFVFDTEAQLSGGEKTMASLSLFLAINLILKTPFLIFDEADEYLDGNNTMRYTEVLIQFMKQRGVQCILITHKDMVFENSESLVGVTLDRRYNSSICYSLDLREQQQQIMIN